MNKKFELRNNKNANNYECLLKRMLYCSGNGQGLLYALGVTLVCHASNVFPGSKRAFVKINGLVVDLAYLAILEPLAQFGCFLNVLCFGY